MASWTTEQLDWLRAHWTAPIATLREHLGRSNDSIFGKGRDLGLPSRRNLTIEAIEVAPAPRAEPRVKAAPAPKPFLGRPPKHVHPLLQVRRSECHWPIGDPKKPGFGYCREKVVEGRPYCHEHCQKAYTGARAPRYLVPGLDQPPRPTRGRTL